MGVLTRARPSLPARQARPCRRALLLPPPNHLWRVSGRQGARALPGPPAGWPGRLAALSPPSLPGNGSLGNALLALKGVIPPLAHPILGEGCACVQGWLHRSFLKGRTPHYFVLPRKYANKTRKTKITSLKSSDLANIHAVRCLLPEVVKTMV